MDQRCPSRSITRNSKILFLLIYVTLNEFPLLSPFSKSSQLVFAADPTTVCLTEKMMGTPVKILSTSENAHLWNGNGALSTEDRSTKGIGPLHGMVKLNFLLSNYIITTILVKAEVLPAGKTGKVNAGQFVDKADYGAYGCNNYKDSPNNKDLLCDATDPDTKIKAQGLQLSSPGSSEVNFLWFSIDEDHPPKGSRIFFEVSYLILPPGGSIPERWVVRTLPVEVDYIAKGKGATKNGNKTCDLLKVLMHHVDPPTTATTTATTMSTISTTSTTVKSTSKTTPSTTTMSTPSTTEDPKEAHRRKELVKTDQIIKDIYVGCTKERNCLGDTPGCLETATCRLLVSYFPGEEYFRYAMFGEFDASVTEAYVAVGWSDDRSMGKDSVVECVVLGEKMGTYLSWNEGKNNYRSFIMNNTCTPERIGDIAQCNVTFKETTRGKKYLLCDFLRRINTNFRNVSFDTGSMAFYVLLVRGTNLTKENVGYHNLAVISENAIELWKPIRVETPAMESEANGNIIRFHGAVMIVLWMIIVPTGIFIARYFKETYTSEPLFSKPVWWWLHCALHLIGLILLVVSESYMLYTFGLQETPHSISGLVVLILYVLLCSSGWYSPHDVDQKRFFVVVHGVIARLIELTAIILIMFSGQLTEATIPCHVSLIAIFHIVSQIVFFIILGCHFKWLDAYLDVDSHDHDLLSPLPLQSLGHGEAPGGRTRFGLLIVFILVVCLWSFVLIIGLATQKDKSHCDFAQESENKRGS